MGISSALNAGIMGLNVNSSKLAAISDNIANSETKGYKRADVDFSSLVTAESTTSYDAGGVRALPRRDVDERGALLATRNGTDLAIAGSGFFPVTNVANINDNPTERPLKLVTTGSFNIDSTGVLSTASGLALMGWQADANGTIPTQPRETATALTPVRINALDVAAEPTGEIALAVNLPATDAAAAAPAQDPSQYERLPIEYIDLLGGSQTLDLTFANSFDLDGNPLTTGDDTRLANNTWRMTVDDGFGTTLGIDLEFDTTAGNGGELLNVYSATTPPTTVAEPLYDPATGVLALTLVSGQELAIDIGALGTRQGIRQLDADFQPITIDKDGFPAARLSGIEINAAGILEAVYDSGFRQTLYQIPVATVENANGLKSTTAQAYELSNESGQFFLYDAGDGPTGDIVANALEESTTDIAAELTSLIRTQRAYSSNASVIRTVDEMLQETTNLKR